MKNIDKFIIIDGNGELRELLYIDKSLISAVYQTEKERVDTDLQYVYGDDVDYFIVSLSENIFIDTSIVYGIIDK